MKILTTIVVSLLMQLFIFQAPQASDDPLFFRQWQFKGNGVASDLGNYNLGVLDSESQYGVGGKNTLMIIALGVDTEHEDLSGAIWTNPDEIPGDNIDNDNNGYVDDVHGINVNLSNGELTDNDGWGTNIAGIVAAQVNNGVGIRGVSQGTELVVCKIPDNINSVNVNRQIEIVNKCVDYAISLGEKSTEVFAIAMGYYLHPHITYRKITEQQVAGMLPLIEKIEQHNLLWINAINDGPPQFPFFLLDYTPLFPHSIHSPNHVMASRLNRRFMTVSNYGRTATTSIPTEDIMTTTPFDKYESNGNYMLELTADDEGATLSEPVQIIEHPNDEDKSVWFVEAFSNNGGITDIITPTIDLKNKETSKLMIDIALRRDRTINSYNTENNPIYNNPLGRVYIQFRVDQTGEWQYFSPFYRKSRGIWDVFAAELDFNRNFDPQIQNDSTIEFRIRISGDATYIESFKVWAEEDGEYIAGYDYSLPESAGLALLAGMAARIKSIHHEWPAWKIANALTSQSAYNEFFPGPDSYPRNQNGVNVLSFNDPQQYSIECKNRVVQTRLIPAFDTNAYSVVDQDFKIKTKSINCEAAGEPYTYIDALTGETFTAEDNGEGFDSIANDGIGILSITSQTTGTRNFTNDFDSDFTLRVLNQYKPAEAVDFAWVELDSNATQLNWSLQDAPFEVRIGGSTFDVSKILEDSSSWSHNGLVSGRHLEASHVNRVPRSGTLLSNSDTPLTSTKDSHLSQLLSGNNVAEEVTLTHYDDAIFVDKSLDNVRIYIAPLPVIPRDGDWIKGEAPNRQLIVSYQEAMQIVFAENEGSILFNFGELPEELEGISYEIGIEIGGNYRQRKTITLSSNTSYSMDVDTDGDGILDAADEDNDNDGVRDSLDLFPYNTKESRDFDGDGLGDNADPDDDNDGYLDTEDAFPFNPKEYRDTDGDGIGDNSDPSPFGRVNQINTYDFNGDGKSDIAIRRPRLGRQFIKISGSGNVQRINFGTASSDIPISGDFDGDGIADIAVRRPGNRVWYIKNSSGKDLITQNSDGITRLPFGYAEDIPVPGDYDGDGKTDIAVRRSETFEWIILNSSGLDNISGFSDGITRFRFGLNSNDIPVPADYDGDGLTDLAVRRPGNHTWYIKNSSGIDLITHNQDGITRKRFGSQSSDIPVPADFDGDGRADLAVRRPSTSYWYVLNSSGSNYNSEKRDGIQRVEFGKFGEDIPIVADYDGDGYADFAVRRTSNGYQYVKNSTGIDLITGNRDGITRLHFGKEVNDVPLAANMATKSRLVAN